MPKYRCTVEAKSKDEITVESNSEGFAENAALLKSKDDNVVVDCEEV